MVEAIAPVVCGGDRRRYVLAVFLHTLGAAVAAGLLGALLGATGGLMGAPWGRAGLLILAALAAAYALREAGLPLPLPDRHKQVPEWWRSFFSPPVAALLYGFGLGVGFLTFLTFGTFVAVAAAALLSGEPALGIALCAPFGAARGLSVAISWSAQTSEETGDVVERLERLMSTGAPRALNAAALVAVAAVAAGGALGS